MIIILKHAQQIEDIPHDCLGVSCGGPPKYDFATTEYTEADHDVCNLAVTPH